MIKDDLVFLAAKDYFEAGILESALKEQDILFEKRIDGAGVAFTSAFGPATQFYSFLVLERDYERAQEIVDYLFNNENQDTVFCPYCNSEMEKGIIRLTKAVPPMVYYPDNDKKGKALCAKYNELTAYYCKKCDKVISIFDLA